MKMIIENNNAEGMEALLGEVVTCSESREISQSGSWSEVVVDGEGGVWVWVDGEVVDWVEG